MIGVAIGTFGDKSVWAPLAMRALESVYAQAFPADAVRWVHSDALHNARNEAARDLIEDGCDWLIFLDADDELDKFFVGHMVDALDYNRVPPHWLDVFRPSTVDIVDGVPGEPFCAQVCSLLERNFVTIGSMHSARLFERIGGFHEWPVLEDWDYWLRAWEARAYFGPVVERAIYRVHEETGRERRNFGDGGERNAVAATIRNLHRKQALRMGLFQ